MLPKLIAFAVTSGLAKKAWDHYRDGRNLRRRNGPLQDITEVVAKPAATQPGRKPAVKRRKSEGPSA